MGAATAEALSSAGAQVNLSDIDKKGAEEIAKKTGSEIYIGDVSNSEFCDLTINSIAEKQGQIDILINAAGRTRADGRTPDHSLQSERNMLCAHRRPRLSEVMCSTPSQLMPLQITGSHGHI